MCHLIKMPLSLAVPCLGIIGNCLALIFKLIYFFLVVWSHTPVELNKLFGLIDGNIIFESSEHENEFILTEEHEKAIEEFLNSLNGDGIND